MEGCPSFLSCVSKVMSSKLTGFSIVLNTLLTIDSPGRLGPGYTDPGTGWVCPKQAFAFGSFHSLPLKKKKKEKLRNDSYAQKPHLVVDISHITASIINNTIHRVVNHFLFKILIMNLTHFLLKLDIYFH